MNFNDSAWASAAPVASAPTGALSWPAIQPVRKVRTYTAIKLSEPAPGVFVFDFGQNMVRKTRMSKFCCTGLLQADKIKVDLQFNFNLVFPWGTCSRKVLLYIFVDLAVNLMCMCVPQYTGE